MASKIKIVHVVEAFGGGVYSFLTEFCNELSKHFEIIIIYSERKETPENFKKDFNSDIKFIKLDMCRGLNPYKNIKSLFQLKSTLRKESPDIIHLHSSKAGFLGRIASYYNGFNMEKVFYNPHGFSFLQQNENKFKINIFLKLEKIASKFGGVIIGCSKGEYEEALKISDKCVNINNAIDTEKIDNIIKENDLDKNIYKNNKKITIGTVGRICYQKNPILFNEIAEMYPQYQFIWIGDGDLKNELVAENITITGWRERKEVIREMLKFDIFILTSLWEGLPISLLEAMYLAKPVIVSDVIGNRDVIINDKNGYIVKSIEGFKEVIDKLSNYSDLRNKLSINATNCIYNNYCKKIMINKYLIAYKNISVNEEKI